MRISYVFPEIPGAPAPSNWRLGIGSYALRWNVEMRSLSAVEVVDLAAKLGAKTLQLQDNLPIEDMTPVQLEQLAARAAEHHLRLELGIRGSRAQQIRQAVRTARALGAGLLRVVVSAPGWEPSAAELALVVQSLLPDLHQYNVALALENHFDLHPQELAALVAQINDPLVGICLDPFNAVSKLDGLQETIRCLAPFALSVHIKDVKVERFQTGFYVHGCPLGEGLLDLPFLLRTLREAGKYPALLVEAWMDRQEDEASTCAQEEVWVRSGLDYLHKNITEEEKQS